MLKQKYKYIKFEQIMGTWHCSANKGGIGLGFLDWNARWKQYEFVPAGHHIAFTQDCLMDIADFIRQLESQKK